MISAKEALEILVEKEKEYQASILAKRERLLEDIERRIKEAAMKRERKIVHRIPNIHIEEFQNIFKIQGFKTTKSFVRDAKHCDLTIEW